MESILGDDGKRRAHDPRIGNWRQTKVPRKRWNNSNEILYIRVTQLTILSSNDTTEKKELTGNSSNARESFRLETFRLIGGFLHSGSAVQPNTLFCGQNMTPRFCRKKWRNSKQQNIQHCSHWEAFKTLPRVKSSTFSENQPVYLNFPQKKLRLNVSNLHMINFFPFKWKKITASITQKG